MDSNTDCVCGRTMDPDMALSGIPDLDDPLGEGTVLAPQISMAPGTACPLDNNMALSYGLDPGRLCDFWW